MCAACSPATSQVRAQPLFCFFSFKALAPEVTSEGFRRAPTPQWGADIPRDALPGHDRVFRHAAMGFRSAEGVCGAQVVAMGLACRKFRGRGVSWNRVGWRGALVGVSWVSAKDVSERGSDRQVLCCIPPASAGTLGRRLCRGRQIRSPRSNCRDARRSRRPDQAWLLGGQFLRDCLQPVWRAQAPDGRRPV